MIISLIKTSMINPHPPPNVVTGRQGAALSQLSVLGKDEDDATPLPSSSSLTSALHESFIGVLGGVMAELMKI